MSLGRPSNLSLIRERFRGMQWYVSLLFYLGVPNVPAEIRCYHRTSYILPLASDWGSCQLKWKPFALSPFCLKLLKNDSYIMKEMEK